VYGVTVTAGDVITSRTNIVVSSADLASDLAASVRPRGAPGIESRCPVRQDLRPACSDACSDACTDACSAANGATSQRQPGREGGQTRVIRRTTRSVGPYVVWPGAQQGW